jgi:hypothetical protein
MNRRKDRQCVWAHEDLVGGQATRKAHKTVGRTEKKTAHRVRQAQLHRFEAEQAFAVFGLGNTIRHMLRAQRRKICRVGRPTAVEYMQTEGPGQIWLSRATRKG